MPSVRTAATIAAIVFAIALPLFGAVKAKTDITSHPLVKFDIEPYDPRDLLYGHYMVYSIKWSWEGGAPEGDACPGGGCCLCVGEGSINPPVKLTACPPHSDALPACKHLVPGTYQQGGRFNLENNRYYVDESVALPLEKLFRDKREDFSIGLSIPPSGKPFTKDLYVGGMPLRQYLIDHKDELLSAPDAPALPARPSPQPQN